MPRPRKSTKPRKEPSDITSATMSVPVPAHTVVARRAYELFVGRGGEHGHDLDDWLAAERELSSANDGGGPH